MKKTGQNADVGVIVGRFQVKNLHDGHIQLIEHVCSKHQKVIIFLGLSPTKATINNPLDFEARKQMLLQRFPNVNVLYIKDCKYDDVWSKRLDEQIRDVTGPSQTVMLYGSRDCFIKRYAGGFKTTELEQEVFISGSEIRKDISRAVIDSADFRAGVIWATQNGYPKVYTTVDIAIIDYERSKVLLAKKPDERGYRFVGGFASPTSNSFEDDAIREAGEETGLEVDDLQYIFSTKIDCWRYRGETDVIKTLFYVAKYVFGRPAASDDISEVRWFDIASLNTSIVEKEHEPLMNKLIEYIKQNPDKFKPAS